MSRFVPLLFALWSASALADAASVLVLNLNTSGLSDEEAKAVNDIVGQSVSRAPGYEILTAADLSRVLDVEAQKQAMGCTDESCMADIAGDLGARYVVFGSVAQLGETFVVQLTLFDGDTNAAVRRVRRDASAAGALPRAIDDAATELMDIQGGFKVAPYLSIGGGAVAGVGALALIFAAARNNDVLLADGRIASAEQSFVNAAGDDERSAALETARDAQAVGDRARGDVNVALGAGGVLIAVGLAALGVGLVMWSGASE